MQTGIISTALMIAVFAVVPSIAEEAGPACEIESIGRMNLSSSAESDFIIASGNKCHLDSDDMIHLTIRTYDGRTIYEGEIEHPYLGTEGISEEEDFERTIAGLADSQVRRLPNLDRFDVDYSLGIDRDDYERLRASQAPAYAFKHYYAGETLIVYDEEVGRMVKAISYGT